MTAAERQLRDEVDELRIVEDELRRDIEDYESRLEDLRQQRRTILQTIDDRLRSLEEVA